MRILVTGASGFIGRAVVEDLAAQGHRVRAAMRQPADIFSRTVEVVAVSDLARPLEWRPLLSDIDTVVHLAGIAHTTSDIGDELYDRVNRAATAALAAAAARNRIQRLVFVSSIRAQAGPAADHALTETDTPHPIDAYGRSKLAAEDAIRAAELPFTILRPALIYGPGVKGNLAALIRLARSPWPLPLGALRNRRSLLARSNLVAAIHLALATPAMLNQTYVVADPAARWHEAQRSRHPLASIAAPASCRCRRRCSRWHAKPQDARNCGTASVAIASLTQPSSWPWAGALPRTRALGLPRRLRPRERQALALRR